MTVTIIEGDSLEGRGLVATVARLRREVAACGGLAAASDLARRWGVSATRVRQLAALDGFPEPVGRVCGDSPVWAVREADAWRARRLRAAGRARGA